MTFQYQIGEPGCDLDPAKLRNIKRGDQDNASHTSRS